MKTPRPSQKLNPLKLLWLTVLLSLLASCTGKTPQPPADEAPEQLAETETTVWHVKAIHPEGRFLDLKALDAEGNIYDVKAFQDTEQRQLMDIKALIGGQRTPVKILASPDEYAPVKAIGEDGAIFDIKALENGVKLDVKGVKRSGNIIHIKAISPDGAFYGVKAISPEGKLNDVKGVKVSEMDIETVLNGVEVHAHVKALPQSEEPGNAAIWHIKAIHPDGQTIDIKALDKEGNPYDVKAIQDSGQRQLMDVKALMGEQRLPVKILVSDAEYAPVKALGTDGTVYDIKALWKGEKLDVKGVRRSGNITHIKAIAADGSFYGIKAISPEGLLNDVKGVKMMETDLETTLSGVAVHAHIKALPQMD
jgi:hypothetical protein